MQALFVMAVGTLVAASGLAIIYWTDRKRKERGARDRLQAIEMQRKPPPERG